VGDEAEAQGRIDERRSDAGSALEHRWALRWNLPVGVSLLAVARKP